MNAHFRLFLSDKPIRYFLIVCLSFIIFQSIITAVIFPRVPPYLPFLNSMPWGEGRLTPSYALIFLPIMLLTLLVVNTIFSAVLYRKYALIGRILTFNTFLLVFLGFLAFLQILFLVF